MTKLKAEKPNKLNELVKSRKTLEGVTEFLSSPFYANIVEPALKSWLNEAEAVFDTVKATPEQLKDAQLKMYYVKQLQRLMFNALEDWQRKSESITSLTGEA